MKRLIFAAALVLLCQPLLAQKAEFLGELKGETPKERGFGYQGMDINGNYMLSCQNRGPATIYRLKGKNFTTAGQFHLGSWNKHNHANTVSFGVEKVAPGDPLPVAYVSQAYKRTVDGRKDLLYVERIAPDMASSTLVQTIFYDDVNHDFGYALQWAVDRNARMLSGYGNTINNTDSLNRHRIIKFRLPSLSEGLEVVLRPEDAIENYLIEEISDFRFNPIGQGLYIRKGKLYMPTGLGRPQQPSELYIWDLRRRTMQRIDLSEITTGELEDISFYRGWFWLQGQDGVFRLRL